MFFLKFFYIFMVFLFFMVINENHLPMKEQTSQIGELSLFSDSI